MQIYRYSAVSAVRSVLSLNMAVFLLCGYQTTGRLYSTKIIDVIFTSIIKPRHRCGIWGAASNSETDDLHGIEIGKYKDLFSPWWESQLRNNKRSIQNKWQIELIQLHTQNNKRKEVSGAFYKNVCSTHKILSGTVVLRLMRNTRCRLSKRFLTHYD